MRPCPSCVYSVIKCVLLMHLQPCTHAINQLPRGLSVVDVCLCPSGLQGPSLCQTGVNNLVPLSVVNSVYKHVITFEEATGFF